MTANSCASLVRAIHSWARNESAVVNCVLSWLLSETTELRDRLEQNTQLFRREMTDRGFNIVPGEHPICPIMLGDARVAGDMAQRMMDEGVYVIGFSFPVVPKGKARIRVQISAAHDTPQLERAVTAFAKVGRELGIIK